MFKSFSAAKLTGLGKSSIKAMKLAAPIVLNDLEETKASSGGDTGYVDPFLGIKKMISLNYNPLMDEKTFAKVDTKKVKKEKKEQDAIDKKIMEFKEHKAKVPKPTVRHTKNPLTHRDILINSYTLAIGGKTLLETAVLRLAKGRKYGLIGRNGVGKTTMLNEITRKDIPDFPKDMHVASVEQEIDGNDVSVIDTILSCDEERTNLLNELKEVEAVALSAEEKETRKGVQAAKRLEEIHKRLVEIEANKAEGAASKILIGLGFHQDDLKRPTMDFSGGWKMR